MVAIAVIAVLTAILLPALAHARKAARSTVCLSHLRSLGQAVGMYRHDHKDRIPVAAYYPSVHSPYLKPFDALVPYLDTPFPPPIDHLGEAVPTPPYNCPADDVIFAQTGFSYHYTPTQFFQVLQEHTVQRIFTTDPNAAVFIDPPSTPHRNAVRLDGSAEPFNGRVLKGMP